MYSLFKSWIAAKAHARSFLTIAFLAQFLASCNAIEGPDLEPEPQSPPRPPSTLLGFWGAREPEMPEASAIGTNACQVGNANPVLALRHLDEAAAFGIRCSLRIVGGHSFYEDANGDFSLDMYLARVDEFWEKAEELGVEQALLHHVAAGTWWGVMLLDDLGNIGLPTAEQIDAMAARTKQYAPLLSTYVSHRATKLLPGTYRTVDGVMVQYRANMGDHIRWADNQIHAARARNIPVVIFSLQALNGGSGESGQGGSLSGSWAMSADEILVYGTEFLSQPEAAGLYAWEFDPDEVLAGDCASNDYWMDRCGAGSGRADAWRQLRDQADDIPARSLLRD
jgi:hypothetical protein